MNPEFNERRKSGIALIVMGPSACGKSEVATALSKHYKCGFIDADSFHSSSNKGKMSNGIPLTDQDRLPWLQVVREQLVSVFENKISSAAPAEVSSENVSENVYAVAACSALKKSYREILRGNERFEKGSNFRTIFIFLNCSASVLEDRISKRKGHFMKANMLQGQLNTLEKPDADELAITVDGDQIFTAIISDVVARLPIVVKQV